MSKCIWFRMIYLQFSQGKMTDHILEPVYHIEYVTALNVL